MGETLQPFTTCFNRSLRVESRAERLTGDAGVVVLREIMERSGIVEWIPHYSPEGPTWPLQAPDLG